MRRVLVSLAVAVIVTVFAGLPLAAQTGTWTAVASTGIVDESATGIYAFGTSNLGYSPVGSLAPIVARYNVTNTFSTTDTPPWTIFELGYFDNSPSSSVQAVLFQVNPCTGVQTAICVINSVDNAAATCNSCQFGAATFNFAARLYYVQLTISRNAVAASPQAFTLRIR